MIHLQMWTAVLVFVGMVATAVFVVAAYKKVNHETFEASNRTWNDAVDALKEHNSALRNLIEDAERGCQRASNELATCKGVILVLEADKVRLEREKGTLTSRNIFLFDLVQELRAKMKRNGMEPGPEPNGNA